ncbi:PucR family transcriptional regulator [Nocardia asteroides]|uniref:PucR family transcriptional regulator n=1 Tax=Nocardia asteroides TaxID=1824 RepID=UPI001E33EE5A|nr:helix-turn-helix domain-containing protein [Nocardia asteroides]UGT55211.1 helix-turn-helix domain-containing protein [Nocardia asteroides]
MTTASIAAPVAKLAADLLEQVDSLADQLLVRITDQIAIYGTESIVSRDELRTSLIANMDQIVGRLIGERGEDLSAPRDIGRTRAAQDMPLPEVLRAYRFGFAFVWERLLAAARDSGQRSVDALLDTATTIWELADDFSLALTESYREALGERMIEADRRRSGILSAILDGPASGSLSAWEVAKLLDLPYEGTFLVVVAEVKGVRSAALPRLEDRLRQLDVGSAWRSQPHHEIGVLSLGRRRDPADVLAEVGQVALGRVGVSPVFARLDGAARALRLAQVALESLPPGTKGLRRLEDEPHIDLLVRDRETTGRFVLRVLRGVLATPDHERTTLLATATAWIDARGSAAQAGRQLYCHQNTVRQRIRRLEEHLGGSLDDPRLLSDLTIALQAIRVFPELGNRLDS